ncbi:hypothetical protein HPB51_000020 [Rhipicephalus microplus]|uniref:Short-chain dehydrogenase/reductase 3 n=1 Tax=Rhipicephalus microplus TaxID=6941 RepID=A0A9J6E5K2_RHIMP|nr:hypothetical protein HPB51_000020 [Rhipicephalus microplus]
MQPKDHRRPSVFGGSAREELYKGRGGRIQGRWIGDEAAFITRGDIPVESQARQQGVGRGLWRVWQRRKASTERAGEEGERDSRETVPRGHGRSAHTFTGVGFAVPAPTARFVELVSRCVAVASGASKECTVRPWPRSDLDISRPEAIHFHGVANAPVVPAYEHAQTRSLLRSRGLHERREIEVGHDDHREENNQSVADEIKLEVGVSAHAYQCDVSDESQVRELARRVTQEVGPVSILVNNAAVTQCQPLLTLRPEQIRRTLDVNLLSHFWMIQEFLPGMLVQKEGHIVAMSSIAGYVGTGYLTDYCASKFAVRGLMCALDEELYQLGLLDKIKLTTVCPMAINTGMFKEPKSRFPWLAPILETKVVADRTLDAILREELEVVIPHRILIMHRLMLYDTA